MSLNALLTNLESSKYPQSTMMRLLLVLVLFTAAVSAVSKHGRRKHFLVEIEDEVGRIYLSTLLQAPHDSLNFICAQIAFKL